MKKSKNHTAQNNMSAAVVIASHRSDYARCRLLVESIERFVEGNLPMYIIVPSADIDLFLELKSSDRIKIVNEETLLPWWIFNLPFTRKWRLSLCTYPLRGWIIQQLCKLNISKVAEEDFYIIFDSDIIMLRNISHNAFINKENKIRLLSVPDRGKGTSDHTNWHKVAGKLLGIGKKDYFGSGYIGNIITWRRDTLQKLHKTLEKNNFLSWQRAVANNITFSEYILYGVFSEHVIAEDSGHYPEAQNIVLEYWEERNLTDAEIVDFFNRLEPHHVGVMISAKAGISVERYEKIVREIWEKQG